MLIELVKQHAFTDLMSKSPFFFDQSFSDSVFIVTMTKQNIDEIILKDQATNYTLWKLNKMNKEEVKLVDYKEFAHLTDGQRVMIWSAFKKLVHKQFLAILIPNEHNSCFSQLLTIEKEKEVVCVGNKHYIYIPS